MLVTIMFNSKPLTLACETLLKIVWWRSKWLFSLLILSWVSYVPKVRLHSC